MTTMFISYIVLALYLDFKSIYVWMPRLCEVIVVAEHDPHLMYACRLYIHICVKYAYPIFG